MPNGSVETGQVRGLAVDQYDINTDGKGLGKDEILDRLIHKNNKIVYYQLNEDELPLVKDTYQFFYSLILQAGKTPSLNIKTMLGSALKSGQFAPDVKFGAMFLREFSDNQGEIKGLNRQRLFQAHKTFQNYVANHIREVITKYPRRCIEWHDKALNLAFYFSKFAGCKDAPAGFGTIYGRYCKDAMELQTTAVRQNTTAKASVKKPQNSLNGTKKELKQLILEAKNDDKVKSPAQNETRPQNIIKFLTANYERFPKINAYLKSRSSEFRDAFINKLALLISQNYSKINDIFLVPNGKFFRTLNIGVLNLEKEGMYNPAYTGLYIPGEDRLSARQDAAAKAQENPIIKPEDLKKGLENKIMQMARTIRNSKSIKEAKPQYREGTIERILTGAFGDICQEKFIKDMAKIINSNIETRAKSGVKVSPDKEFADIKAWLNSKEVRDMFITDALVRIVQGENIFDTKGKGEERSIKGEGIKLRLPR